MRPRACGRPSHRGEARCDPLAGEVTRAAAALTPGPNRRGLRTGPHARGRRKNRVSSLVQRDFAAVAVAGLVALIAGCTRGRPGTRAGDDPARFDVDAGRSIAAASRALALPPRPLDRCVVAAAAAASLSVTPALLEASPKLPYGTCWSGPRGAWSIALDPPPAGGTEARGWTAIHVDATGAVTRRARAFHASREDTSGDGPSVPDFGWIDDAWAEAYDFNGDGDPELFVGLHAIWSSHTGLELAESILYTFTAGAIEKYAPATSFAIWKLEDRDNDGRPDIVTSSPYARSRGGSTPVFSPTLIAHALADGSFSTTDAVAERAARKACPTKPALATLRRPSPTRQGEDARLACARMWGLSVDAIATQLHLDPVKKDDWPSILDVTPPITLR
jgi:hypothetical protein